MNNPFLTVLAVVCAISSRASSDLLNFPNTSAIAFVTEVADAHPVSVRTGSHENQDWFEFRGFHYTDEKKYLPRVLLVGDSISATYRLGVRDRFEGVANVTWLTMCYCVTTPNFMRLLNLVLEDAEYDVIHFNNGLHSLRSDRKCYESKLREAIELVRRRQPRAKLIWARTTPLADSAKDGCVGELNEVADRVVAKLGIDVIDDLYNVMLSVSETKRWTDGCHPQVDAANMLTDSVVKSIRPFIVSNGRMKGSE